MFFKPSKDKFARLFLKELKRAVPLRTYRYDAAQFCLQAEGDEGTVFLPNMYDEYCASPRLRRAEMLRRACRGIAEGMTDLPAHIVNAEDKIVVRLRERWFYHAVPLQVPDNEIVKQIARKRLTDHLCIEVAYDTPDAIASVTTEHLTGWKISVDEAIEIGLKNLRKGTLKWMTEIAPGLYGSDWDDDYDAARLLLADKVKELGVKGEHVALAPNRATLVVTGADDVDGLKGLIEAANMAVDRPRLMTMIPLVLRNGQWHEFLPDTSHPLHNEIKLLWAQWDTGEYGEQTELLQAKFGDDIFVASYTAMKKDAGEVFSYATLSEGLDTLLPRTEEIAFVDKDEKFLGAVPWEKMLEICGDIFEETEYYPPRYRVRQWPTDGQIRALASVLEQL